MTMTKESLQKTFLELVKINSHHPDEQEMIDFVTAWFDSAGIQWKQDGFGNVYAYIPGVGEPVLLSTHLDIPEPAPHVNPIIEGDIIRSDGTSILGADPKTCLAVILELVRDLVRADANHAPLEILLTRGEEKGLLGALHADYSFLKSTIGFCLDEDGPVNQVTIKAPGYVRFDAAFTGKVVHIREPEKGINALQVFCHAMRDVPWGHACEGVTWNIGQFRAGTARIEEQFCAAAHEFGATCDVAHSLMFEGYDLDRGHPLFQRMNVVYEQMGIEPRYHETYGGSDVNVFVQHGITAVTLGSGYYNAHGYTEYANISDMAEIYEFLSRFLSTVAIIHHNSN